MVNGCIPLDASEEKLEGSGLFLGLVEFLAKNPGFTILLELNGYFVSSIASNILLGLCRFHLLDDDRHARLLLLISS